jgi:hypothetical protein
MRGVDRDRAEIDVAPLSVRASAVLAGAAPGVVAKVQRRFGGSELSAEIARGQVVKR